MLYDKGFHDYDYTIPKKPKEKTPANNETWSDSKLSNLLKTAIDPNTGKSVSAEEKEDKEYTKVYAEAERIQSEILADLKLKQKL